MVSSIIVGIAGIGRNDNLGRLGLKTLGIYTLSSFLAIMIGLTVVNVMEPGISDGQPAKEALALSDNTDTVLQKVEGRGVGDVAQVFIRMIPTNVIQAAAQGQMLGLIVFSLLFGFFLTRITREHGDRLLSLTQGVYETMMAMTLFVIKFTPIGVFALVAKTVAMTGFEAFVPLLWFFASVVIALALHMFVVYPSLLLVMGVSPRKHFAAMMPALLTAFSTASSSSTLPLTLKSVEENAGVSKETSSFVLPLGATVNMDGTALYECVAAMFLAQAYGIDLGLGTQFTIVLIALLTSIGVAGIPAASLVAITIILAAIGLPLEAVGLILVTDRILDMCRTSVNVFGDSCASVIVARSEGEETLVAR